MLPSPLLLPGRTVSGPGVLPQLAAETSGFGPRGVIVHGRVFDGERRNAVLEAFRATAGPAAYRHRGSEPTLDEVEALRAWLREQRPDWMAAIGGGSVLDLAKATTGLLHAPETVAAYQQGCPIPAATVPFIAVPTTAGTGSEATVVAVLTDTARGIKQSIRHPSFMPRLVLLDPTLLLTCPKPALAAAGMDALIDWGLDVNLKGTIYFCHAVIGTMIRQKRGVIITLSSVTGLEGSGNAICYSAAKSGMLGLTKSLALAGAPHGVRACCVSPGPVLTRPGMADMRTRLGRAAKPAEVVDLILYLCSDKAAFITGSNYLIDDGHTCGAID